MPFFEDYTPPPFFNKNKNKEEKGKDD